MAILRDLRTLCDQAELLGIPEDYAAQIVAHRALGKMGQGVARDALRHAASEEQRAAADVSAFTSAYLRGRGR